MYLNIKILICILYFTPCRPLIDIVIIAHIVYCFLDMKPSPVPARRRFFARGRVFPRAFSSCTRAAVLFHARPGFSARFLFLYPRGGIFSHAAGFFRALSLPIPARQCFFTRGRVFPRAFSSCTRAAAFLRAALGVSTFQLLILLLGRLFLIRPGFRLHFSPLSCS